MPFDSYAQGASSCTWAQSQVRAPAAFVVSPALVRDLAARVVRIAVAVEQCCAGMLRAADTMSRCPATVAHAGAELFGCVRSALTAESEELCRAARAISDGAEAYVRHDVHLASVMDHR